MMRNRRATQYKWTAALALFGGLMALLAPAAVLSDSRDRLGSGAYWDKEVTIERVERRPPPRKGAPPPPVRKYTQQKPLLTLEWQMLRCAGNAWVEADPKTPFRVGEKWRLKLRPNQSGYLYVFSLTEKMDGAPLESPDLIFPDSRIADGGNLIKKNEPYTFPSGCATGATDPGESCVCSFEFTAAGANEVLVLLFSRDLLTDLPDYLRDGSAVNPQYIGILKERYRQQQGERAGRPAAYRNRGLTGQHAFWVRNYDRKNNEELVEIIRVPTLAEGDAQGGPVAAQGVQERDIDLEYDAGKVDGMRVALLQDAGGQFTPVAPGRVFQSGEKIRVEFEANFDGYVYILNIAPSGRACLLFPYAGERNGRVAARRAYTLPRDRSLLFTGDKGVETLQFYLARAPVKLFDDALADAIKRGETKACLGESADSVVRELAGRAARSQKTEIVAGEGQSVLGGEAGRGIQSRKARLYLGKDKARKETTVAADSQEKAGGKLAEGEYIFFDLRLVHQ